MTDFSAYLPSLLKRSPVCELCAKEKELEAWGVGPNIDSAERCVLCCGACREKIRKSDFYEKSWYCLRDSIWSEVPAVKVLSARLLERIGGAFALELVEQMYLSEDQQSWVNAESLAGGAAEEEVITKDSHGNLLSNGDSVTLIKDLAVKGGGFTAKRGTMVRNIRLIGDPKNIEGRVNKTMLVLKTEFLKKA